MEGRNPFEEISTWHEGISVRGEVEKILRDAIEVSRRVGDQERERETTEIAQIALCGSMPQVDPEAPAALISCHARAVLSRAWMAYLDRRLGTIVPRT